MKKEEQKEKKNHKNAKYVSAIAICTVMALSLFLAATLAASDVEKGRTDPGTIEEAHAVFNITEAVLEAEEGTPTEEEGPTPTTNKSETDDTISSPGGVIEEAHEVFNITVAVLLEAEEGTPTEEEGPTPTTNKSETDDTISSPGGVIEEAHEVFNITEAVLLEAEEGTPTEEEEPTPITNEAETDLAISSPGWTTIKLEGFPSGWPSYKWSRSGSGTCRYTPGMKTLIGTIRVVTAPGVQIGVLVHAAILSQSATIIPTIWMAGWSTDRST
jgi:hypothetical protein